MPGITLPEGGSGSATERQLPDDRLTRVRLTRVPCAAGETTTVPQGVGPNATTTDARRAQAVQHTNSGSVARDAGSLPANLTALASWAGWMSPGRAAHSWGCGTRPPCWPPPPTLTNSGPSPGPSPAAEAGGELGRRLPPCSTCCLRRREGRPGGRHRHLAKRSPDARLFETSRRALTELKKSNPAAPAGTAEKRSKGGRAAVGGSPDEASGALHCICQRFQRTLCGLLLALGPAGAGQAGTAVVLKTPVQRRAGQSRAEQSRAGQGRAENVNALSAERWR